MIRINLLPAPKRSARASGGGAGTTPLWVAGYLVGLVLWAGGLYSVYSSFSDELGQKKQANRAVERRIATLRQRSARLEELQAELARSRDLEQLVAEINNARTGPTRVLLEFSRVLSKNGGPTIDPAALEALRRENPRAAYRRGWDVRRLWLTLFEEEHRRCLIRGRGRTNEDVAEFFQRLVLSELFEDVALQKTEAIVDSATDLSLIGFELSCTVRY